MVRNDQEARVESSRYCATCVAETFLHILHRPDCASRHKCRQAQWQCRLRRHARRRISRNGGCRFMAISDVSCQFVHLPHRCLTGYLRDQLRQVVGRYSPSSVLGVHVQAMLPARLIGDNIKYLLLFVMKLLALGPLNSTLILPLVTSTLET